MNAKLLLLTAVSGVVAIGATFPRGAHPAPLAGPEEVDIEMFYQYSATDDDAEVTIDVESDLAIETLIAHAPDGHMVVVAHSPDGLGLREVEVESDEPSVEEVQAAYPEGLYTFRGRAVNGNPLFGTIELTHDVVGAPDFFSFSPCRKKVDPTAPVSITWSTVAGAAGGYELIIEQDDTGANLRTTLSAASTSFVIPDGFLAPGLEYEIEMKAVTAEGNKTSASCEFSTQ